MSLCRSSLLIPGVVVSAVCIRVHEGEKQNPAEEGASHRDAALG